MKPRGCGGFSSRIERSKVVLAQGLTSICEPEKLVRSDTQCGGFFSFQAGRAIRYTIRVDDNREAPPFPWVPSCFPRYGTMTKAGRSVPIDLSYAAK